MSKLLSNKDKKNLLALPNVIGEGQGIVRKDGEDLDEVGLIVTVEKKLPPNELRKKDMIPKYINSIKTDVIEIGRLNALDVRRDNSRPFPMGVSIGHYNITAGTAGCIVEKDGEKFILTNNHVAANSNKADIGDIILKAGPVDGGSVQFGTLADFIPIDYQGGDDDPGCTVSNIIIAILNIIAGVVGSKVNFEYRSDPTKDINLVDAAIVKPDAYSRDIINELLGIGKISGTAPAVIGDLLEKSGRTTEVTNEGLVRIVDYDGVVNYGSSGSAYFEDQILIEKNLFSQGGDSGSIVVKRINDKLYAVGLLFAGSNTHTIVSHIDVVTNLLGVTVYTGD